MFVGPTRVWLVGLAMLLGSAATLAQAEGAQGRDVWKGLSVAEALRRLEQPLAERGAILLFTSRVVRDDLIVLREPSVDPAAEPRRAAAEIVAEHGLELREVAGRLVVVPARAPTAEPAQPDAPEEETKEALEEPVAEEIDEVSDEVTVLSRRRSEPFSETVVRRLRDERVEALPHFANDLFHAAKVTPATSGTESSSRLSVRGGSPAELLVVLDGQEILEPYHLQDFDSALSILTPTVVDSASLKVDGVSARYGERMGGVFDLTTVRPSQDLRGRAALAPWYGELGGSGRLGDRGTWMVTGRAGSYRLALAVAGRDENPQFEDLFGKMHFDLGDEQRHSIQIETLLAEDEIQHHEEGADVLAEYTARWSNGVVWGTDLRLLSSRAYLESAFTYGRLARVRRGSEAAPERDLRLDDVRGFESFGARASGDWQPTESGNHSFEFGLDVRRQDAEFDYFTERSLRDVLAPIRSRGAEGITQNSSTLAGDYVGTFVSHDWRLGGGAGPAWRQLRIRTGVRWDDNNLLDDHQLSPRLAVAWTPTSRFTLRSSWGVFHQSQRPYDLQVEDGETELPIPERAEHVSLGGDYRTPGGLLISLEAYERDLDQLRVRYENLFEPISLFPELSSDRVRLAPSSGRSRGYELAMRGPLQQPLLWSFSFARGAVTEKIDGVRVPRAMDQQNALRLELGHRWPSGWHANLALTYHSGWPTTAVDAVEVVDEDGTSVLQPRLGPLRAERLPDYYRLDLRVGRSWSVPLRGAARGRLEFYLDLQNLLDRKNVRGYDDFMAGFDSMGQPTIEARELAWGDFLPSFGLSLDF